MEQAESAARDGRVALKMFIAILMAIAALAGGRANAALDLNRVAVTRLDNGLTLLVLEEHSRPIVSVQMLYKVGGRDDPAGRMGLAHFFEHMAFRASKNFPGTRLVDDIYDAGGEWHGYTWIDQTTYFATAPASELDLLLRIEADRLGRLRIAEEDVKAEFGAVLAEMNQYENDPSSVLFDALLAAAFPVHPYGKNTIGYEGDIAAITKADLDDFYAHHIGPATAVLAVVGDVDRDDVAKRAAKLFGKFKRNAEPVLPAPAEPTRAAVRRVRLTGGADQKLFKIAYPAPAASGPDFAAFLVLQALAAASEGANFLQSDWGVPAEEGSPLAKAAADVATWFIPTAQPYIFLVSGSANTNADETKIEAAVQRAVEALRQPPSAAALEAARAAVKRELLLDIATTEDAAHQLAYFEGVGALGPLLSLPEKVDAVTADDVAAAARRWLDPDRRSIGWLVPGASHASEPWTPTTLAKASPRVGAPAPDATARNGRNLALKNGAAAVIRPSALSPTVTVMAVLAGGYECALCAANDPAPGFTSVTDTSPADELPSLAARVKESISAASSAKTAPPPSTDPAERLEEIFKGRFVSGKSAGRPSALFVAVAGDVDTEEAAALIEVAFGGSPASAHAITLTPSTGDIAAAIGEDKSQAALGYMVEAPAPGSADATAWRVALYILTHHYGGRLGAEAISRRGLVYYIGSDYRAGGDNGLITLSIGVDPEKQDAMAALLKNELARLLTEPPTAKELAAAKRHLIGRRISAVQSNEEIASALARDWVEHGAVQGDDAFARMVEAVTLEELHAVLPRFTKGDIVAVRVGVKEP